MKQQAFAEQVSNEVLAQYDPQAYSPLARNHHIYFRAKRILDLSLGTLMLMVLSPLMIFIALLILFESGWPVIFSQERVGARRCNHGGKDCWKQCTFTCYKFRSMIKDADPSVHKEFVEALVKGRIGESVEPGVIFKLNNDARVTRLGRLLRRTSLDELPQLVNVIRGEMSLVGPRPDVPYAVQCYRPWQHGRLAALPGITGLWQTNGRSNVSFEQMVKMDIEYINSQSFWLDIKILLLTIPAVLSRDGAV